MTEAQTDLFCLLCVFDLCIHVLILRCKDIFLFDSSIGQHLFMYGKLISSIKLGTHSSAVDSVPFPCAAENPINVIKGSSLSLSLFFSLSPKKRKSCVYTIYCQY